MAAKEALAALDALEPQGQGDNEVLQQVAAHDRAEGLR
jgi:hypothetical protein